MEYTHFKIKHDIDRRLNCTTSLSRKLLMSKKKTRFQIKHSKLMLAFRYHTMIVLLKFFRIITRNDCSKNLCIAFYFACNVGSMAER